MSAYAFPREWFCMAQNTTNHTLHFTHLVGVRFFANWRQHHPVDCLQLPTLHLPTKETFSSGAISSHLFLLANARPLHRNQDLQQHGCILPTTILQSFHLKTQPSDTSSLHRVISMTICTECPYSFKHDFANLGGNRHCSNSALTLTVVNMATCILPFYSNSKQLDTT
jgi:hypothetical protein